MTRQQAALLGALIAAMVLLCLTAEAAASPDGTDTLEVPPSQAQAVAPATPQCPADGAIAGAAGDHGSLGLPASNPLAMNSAVVVWEGTTRSAAILVQQVVLVSSSFQQGESHVRVFTPEVPGVVKMCAVVLSTRAYHVSGKHFDTTPPAQLTATPASERTEAHLTREGVNASTTDKRTPLAPSDVILTNQQRLSDSSHRVRSFSRTQRRLTAAPVNAFAPMVATSVVSGFTRAWSLMLELGTTFVQWVAAAGAPVLVTTQWLSKTFGVFTRLCERGGSVSACD